MLDAKTADAYLERIGAKRPERPTTQALVHLHERHVLSVPFENIDFALGRPSPPVGLGEPALDKIIGQNRGGCCYELNGAFYELLLSLGFDAVPLAGRVLEDGEFGPLLGHLTLGVQTEDGDGPWLADVGYGQGFRHPLLLASRAPQSDAQGTFELAETPLGDLDLLRDGEVQYRLELRPRELADFAPMVWWFRSAPQSPFLARQVCSLPTADGRVTLAGRTLTRTVGGHKTKQELTDDAAVLDAYRTWFGIELAAPPPTTGAPQDT
ncbi:arylamine N-acetyltransferase family protein [Streptomyces sp. HUAS TT7]|uniref:arylamine N-acetyltransferase family protein n=1 Tax=Streptomyces sp. HUAS TT7 TaxID=3447507 RepID=UPI003F657B53